MRNEGDFVFSDHSVVARVSDEGFGVGSTWGDFDNDGWLDLYLANRSLTTLADPENIPNRLYRNLGDGTFLEVAGALGVDILEADNLTLQALFLDIENDSDADLYLSTDKGSFGRMQNHLFENTGGAFTDVSVGSGANVSIDSMGVAVGDVDGNGFQDLYCTNIPFGNPLLLNQGNGRFVESAAVAGVEVFELGWGTAFFDFDNDGFLDLYVCNSQVPNHLYEYNGSWPTTNVAAALGVDDPGRSYGIAVADIDGDGDVDLLVQDDDERLKLYINHEGELRHWIKFDIVGEGHNLFAIGAQVRIRVGSAWQMREILAGGNNYKGQNELIVHFGLGDATTVDEAIITWPGGTTRTLTNLAADRTWQIDPLGSPSPSPSVPAMTGGCGTGMAVILLVAGAVVLMVGRGLRFVAKARRQRWYRGESRR